ncbi:MAG: hypothetical protein NTU76_04320, partial [Candidatus Taylorbacteria bacterium]|nr:hypothetical protein [Candidatus Taylorbacteria bacterium]
MEKFPENSLKRFSSPQEELDFLRGEVLKKEKALEKSGDNFTREEIIKQEIENHKNNNSTPISSSDYEIKPKEVESIVLDLTP